MHTYFLIYVDVCVCVCVSPSLITKSPAMPWTERNSGIMPLCACVPQGSGFMV